MSILSKKKVLMVIETWGKGGTETYVKGLAEAFACEDVDVYIVSLSRGVGKNELIFAGSVQVVVVSKAELFKYFKKIRPDIVGLHLYASLLPVALIAKASRIPIVTTLHMPISAWGLRHRLYWRMALSLSDVVLGVSTAVNYELLNLKNLYPAPVPGIINNEFFSIKHKSIDDLFHVFAIGRLEKEKNWGTLVKAISLLPKVHKERVVIDFFGDGSMREDLTDMAKKLHVTVKFHAHIEQTMLFESLVHAKLSVLPSRFEGLGLSALESMAAGVPIITANFPAAYDFIEHGKTGHIFPVGDEVSLMRLVVWHMDNPSESEECGREGQRFIRNNFSAEAAYRPYHEITESILKRPHCD